MSKISPWFSVLLSLSLLLWIPVGAFSSANVVSAGQALPGELLTAGPPISTDFTLAGETLSPLTAPQDFDSNNTVVADTGDYSIGTPSLIDLWVDPLSGNDDHTGLSRQTAFRTIAAAWAHIPSGSQLTGCGYCIQLVSGVYPLDYLPGYMEDRHGAYQFPVIIQAADGNGTALLTGGLNIFNCEYLYLIGFNIVPDPAGDSIHFERCDHVLLRSILLNSNGAAQETFKANQCSYLFVEDCNICGSYGTALDFVAVQHGHIIRNRIHQAGDWCMYLKGGSAYFRIEGNELYDGETGGFTAGQGTGFEFMVSPWLHYETYDIKFINNVIHDTNGAGMGVNGSYNILLAFNTLYRVGQRSHAIEVNFGLRGCDGNVSQCRTYLNAGGWGTAVTGIEVPVPNRNIFIYNNVLYNPPGYRSQWNHFSIQGPRTPSAGTNIPSPAVTDSNLRICGNIIFNGPADLPLGVEDSDQGGQPSNPTCNATLLRSQNLINTLQPQLVNPSAGDFRPATGSNILTYPAWAIPDFSWADAPTRPAVPSGLLSNTVAFDRNGDLHTALTCPGAYQVSGSQVDKTSTTSLLTAPLNYVVTGQSLTLTVAVTSASPGLIATGPVTFRDGATRLAGASLDSAGQASFTAASLAVGHHSLSVVYAGSSYCYGSTSNTLDMVVNRASTAIRVVSSINPAVAGQSVTLTANLSVVSPGAGTPAGMVSFKDGSRLLGKTSLNTALTASLRLTTLAVGAHNITVEYPGSSKYLACISPLITQVISPVPSPVISLTAPLVPGEVKQIHPPQTFTVSGGSPNYVWSWKSDPGSSLPPGLRLTPAVNTRTAVLSGQPTRAGTFKFSLTIRDRQNQTASLSLNLTVYPALDIKVAGSSSVLTRLPDATRGKPYTCALTPAGGLGPFSWSPGADFPSWLKLDPQTGVLSGTPSAYGSIARVNIIVHDGLGYSFTRSFSLRIRNSVSVSASP